MSPRLNIIGGGKVAQALGGLLVRQGGVGRAAVCSRTLLSAERSARCIGSASAVGGIEELPSAELWMVSVPDREISKVAVALAERSAVKPGDVVFHVSGAHTAEELKALRQRGALLGSLHPVRSIADPAVAISQFEGTVCAIEGDEEAAQQLAQLVRRIGGVALQVPPAAKLLCHAGHVFASNYLVAVLDAARQLYEAAGVPPEAISAFFSSIARGALENVSILGTTAALTGPVARGEVELVRDQVAALDAKAPGLSGLYCALALHAAGIAARRGEVPEARLEALRRICLRQGA